MVQRISRAFCSVTDDSDAGSMSQSSNARNGTKSLKLLIDRLLLLNKQIHVYGRNIVTVSITFHIKYMYLHIHLKKFNVTPCILVSGKDNQIRNTNLIENAQRFIE